MESVVTEGCILMSVVDYRKNQQPLSVARSSRSSSVWENILSNAKIRIQCDSEAESKSD